MVNDCIEYRRCRRGDIPTLKELWKQCFASDTDEDINLFFQDIFPLSDSLGGFIDEKAVTMLHLLPAYARHNGWHISVRYLYAGGTHPDYRSRGYYGDLMRYAEEYCRSTAIDAIYLRPADHSLFDYYAALGYHRPIASLAPRDFDLQSSLRCVSMTQYRQNRTQALSRPFVLWEPIASIADAFLKSKTADGWHAATDSAGNMFLTDGERVFEQLPIEQAMPEEAAGAVWLPTTEDARVIEQLSQARSYSHLFGD